MFRAKQFAAVFALLHFAFICLVYRIPRCSSANFRHDQDLSLLSTQRKEGMVSTV